MKQQDWAVIIMAVGISALLAYITGNVLLGGTNRTTEVETVQAISSEFRDFDKDVFNPDALNPTIEIRIGEGQAAPETSPPEGN